MTKLSDETLYERETTILFNELEPDAVLWTASPAMMREWRDSGYPVKETHGGWRCSIAKTNVRLKALKGSRNAK